MYRILLVEDDQDVGMLLEHALLGAGYKVSKATTAAAAELLLAHRSHDLLLADVGLPDGNGADIADRASELGIKTLILTGHALRTRPGRLDRHEYLMKPIRPRELLAVIDRVLASP